MTKPLGYYGIRTNTELETRFESQSVQELLDLLVEIAVEIEFQGSQFDGHHQNSVLTKEDIRDMDTREALQWLKAIVYRAEEKLEAEWAKQPANVSDNRADEVR